MAEDKTKAQELKDAGNVFLNADNPKEAAEKYTEAIALDPDNHVLFSNRSAAYAKLENYSDALKDAEMTVKIKPDWPKAYSRKGTALVYLGRLDEAEEAYNAGLKLDPSNVQLKSGLDECKAKGRRKPGGMGGMPSMMSMGFDNPNLLAKLAGDSRTRGFLGDPAYLKMLEDIKGDTSKLNEYIKDPRLMTTMSVLLGLDLQSGTGRGGAGDYDSDDEEFMPRRFSPPSSAQKKTTFEAMDVDMSPEQAKAKEEKEKGNAAYKKKDFETAIQHYEKAIEADPTEMTFITNLAAVKFEQKDYTACIENCEKAVEIGRQNRADFKLIAKALARAGNASKASKDLKQAIVYYQKALSEHRTPEIKQLLSKVEQTFKEEERLSYIDLDKAEEEKQKGNDCFKAGTYPEATRHYSEAIKRNPDDAKLYSNRAACYTKLAEFTLGMADCEKCIKLDPTFIKGYIRKAKIEHGLKQYSRAQDSYQKALKLDPNHPEALEGVNECMMQAASDPEEVRKRAMADPEVQAILKDPAMRLILEQMQSDPQALQDHLKNPEISNKIQKLMQSGLISIR